MKMKTMNEIYPNGYVGNGVFADLQSYNVPWRDESINAQLDITYYSKSGEKYAGSMITRRIENDELSQNSRDSIAETLFTIYQTKWDKLYSVLFEEYNPIENYRMIESESSNHTIENTIENTGTNTTTDTGTNTVENDATITNQNTNNIDNSVYGFNSASSVNSDETSGTNSGTETTDATQTETRNTTQTETRNLETNTNESGENERQMTRSGNIGVTTSQQLLQSEIELWQWNFFNQVFTDIDNILCLSIY